MNEQVKNLINAAHSASVTISEYLDGTWDGNAEGWRAVIENLDDAVNSLENSDNG